MILENDDHVTVCNTHTFVTDDVDDMSVPSTCDGWTMSSEKPAELETRTINVKYVALRFTRVRMSDSRPGQVKS